MTLLVASTSAARSDSIITAAFRRADHRPLPSLAESAAAPVALRAPYTAPDSDPYSVRDLHPLLPYSLSNYCPKTSSDPAPRTVLDTMSPIK